MKIDKITKTIIFFSFLLLFSAIASKYLSIKLWDYDFFWHLSTGKYIAENKALPEKDPFSFVNNLDENKDINPVRTGLVLKQYWLSQIVFYGIHKQFGDKGIIVLRSFILLTIIFLIAWWFKRQKVSVYIAYPLSFFVFIHTMAFTGERPVLFTMLFVVIVFLILEEFRQKKSRIIFSLIPIMLIWANLHGGFILGIFMISIFMGAETYNYIYRKDQAGRQRLLTLYIAGLAAVAVSALNPTGLSALSTLTSQNKLFQSGVQEYMSPFTLYREKIRPVDWEYILLIGLFPVLAVLRNKKINISHYVFLACLLYMSITALRFVIFYVCIGTMILGMELSYLLEPYFNKLEMRSSKFKLAASLLILISSATFAAGFIDVEKITFMKNVKGSVPKQAVDFIESNKIEGNIFNDMGFGGYLAWRLYPWKKTFIDTRQLNYTVTMESVWIQNAVESIQNKVLPEGKIPLWKRLLDHYEIDIV
ncbi:MAG: hypothetical protein HY758_06950, partial [Nitrospirae bacterium]|nr:hypothetical protein [Nitrospirota bacterium]